MPVYRSLPLVISGTSLTISSSQVRFADGSAAAPAISFGADIDTGIYRPGADVVGIVTAGNLRMVVEGYTATIGNNSLSSAPQNGTLSATAGNGTNIAGANLTIRGGNSTGSGAGGAVIFQTAPAGTSGSTANTLTERMRIESTGDLVFNQTNSLLRLSADGSTTSATLRLAAGTSYSAAQGALILLNTVTANGSLRMLPGNGSTPAVIFANRSDLEVWRVNGNITSGDLISDATNGGNLVFNRLGKGVRVKEGSNALMGVATLVAGTVTVSTTAVTATSRIMLTGQDSSGTAGELTVSARVAGTSFTITSTSGTDTRTVAWIIFEPS